MRKSKYSAKTKNPLLTVDALKALLLEKTPWCNETLRALCSGLDRKVEKKQGKRKEEKRKRTQLKKAKLALTQVEHASCL